MDLRPTMIQFTYRRLVSLDALNVMVCALLADCAVSAAAACFELVLPFLLDCAITFPSNLSISYLMIISSMT